MLIPILVAQFLGDSDQQEVRISVLPLTLLVTVTTVLLQYFPAPRYKHAVMVLLAAVSLGHWLHRPKVRR